MDATRDASLALVRALRGAFAVDVDLETRGLGAQMKSADKSGARLLVLVGEEEWARGGVVLRDLRDGTQEFVTKESLDDTLRARLAR